MDHREDPSILYDITEFITNPIRTGIQRTVFMLARHWPANAPLIPVFVDKKGSLLRLPKRTFAVMENFFSDKGKTGTASEEDIRALPHRGAAFSSAQLRERFVIFNPELFYSDVRTAFYEKQLQSIPERIFFLTYDFLPYINPGWFPRGSVFYAMSYLRMLRDVRNISFISNRSRTDFLNRMIKRERDVGPVFTLGGDALGQAPPAFDPARRTFSMVGTLEPRKNIGIILDAFEALWRDGVDVRLNLIGKMGWITAGLRDRIRLLQHAEKRFQWSPNLDDDQVREAILRSRATLFASHAEGFGLPPLESLSLGVPVIVSANVPSLQPMEPLGQVRLESPSAYTLSEAVKAMLDESFARSKYEEIRRLRLPTWSGCSGAIAKWILETAIPTALKETERLRPAL